MSRTYKDKPYKFKNPEWADDNKYETFEYLAEGTHWKTGEPYTAVRKFFVKRAGYLTKKKKRVDTEWHWMHTPSWWTHMFMNKPQRHASNQYMRQLTIQVDLDEVDPPPLGKKPHVYYW